MNYRSLTSLALRLAGVFILVSGVAGMPNTFVNLYSVHTREALHPSMVLLAMQTLFALSGPLIIGLVLIFFPSVVANRVIKTDVVGSEGSVGYRELQALAFSVLGVYFISIGVFDAVYWVARLRLYYRVIEDAAAAFPRPPAIAPDEFGGLVSSALYLMGGLILLFGATGISHLVQRIRGAAHDER
jgi:hypothetical protein